MRKTPERSSRPDLDLTRREFDRWRGSRPRGARIPETLWRKALDLAVQHGVSRTSQTLCLDYYAVQRRLAATPTKQQTQPTAAAFVEVSMPPTSHAGRCQVAIRDALGDALQIEVSGLCAKDLATFVRAVAGREPCSR